MSTIKETLMKVSEKRAEKSISIKLSAGIKRKQSPKKVVKAYINQMLFFYMQLLPNQSPNKLLYYNCLPKIFLSSIDAIISLERA